MKDFKTRLLKTALITVIFLQFFVVEGNPQTTKFFRDSYSSHRLVEHGIHAIFHMPYLSEKCSRDLKRFGDQLTAFMEYPMGNNKTSMENWALQMLDAWAKIPEGVLSGHVNALGDFDECLAVRATPGMQGGEMTSQFQGKYCLVYAMPNISDASGGMNSKLGSAKITQMQLGERTIENLVRILSITSQAELPIIPSVGTCLPSSCSDEEIFIIVNNLFSKINLIPVTSFCAVDEPITWSNGAIATMSILAVLVGFAIIGSITDLVMQHFYPTYKGTGKLATFVLAFSIPRNGEKFLNTKTSSNDITCLHGIRFLSASWVVLGHSYLMGVIQPLWNVVDTYTMITSSLSLMVILNAAIVVDVFFVIAGFLVAVTVMSMLEKSNGKLNIPLLYVHRYLRITPMYMIIVCFGTFIFPLLGSGPYWHVAKTWAGYCEKNWWKNALYINNLPIYDTLNDPTDAPCHGMAWYLGVDFQLFLLSPFLLFPIWKWKRFGSSALVLVTLGSIVLPGVLTYIYNYLPTSVPFQNRNNSFSQKSYTPTYMRATPYLIGMCVGLIYQKLPKRTLKLSKSVVVAIWMVAFSVGFTVLLAPHKFLTPGYDFKPEESAVYVSGQRTAWSLCISWLIFACATGNGGWINQFLSWRPFVPLGRLTFAIYLVSMHLQFLFHLQYRQPIYFSNYHMINLYFAHLLMSCLIGLLCTLLIEAPLMQVLKLILPTRRKGKERSTLNINANNNNNNNEGTAIFVTRSSDSSPDSCIRERQDSEASDYGSTRRSLFLLTSSNDKLIVQT